MSALPSTWLRGLTLRLLAVAGALVLVVFAAVGFTFHPWTDGNKVDDVPGRLDTPAESSPAPTVRVEEESAFGSCSPRLALRRSSPQTERLGTGRGDLMLGTPGNDEIRSGAGQDRVRGGSAADRIFTGEQPDYAWGGRGPDRIGGGIGADYLYGGPGPDVLIGGEADVGWDWLSGGPGDDVLVTGRGRDSSFGGPGDDCLLAVGGIGHLVPGPGRDRVRGGPREDDVFLTRDGEPDLVNCGAGFDYIRYESGRGPVVLLKREKIDRFTACEWLLAKDGSGPLRDSE